MFQLTVTMTLNVARFRIHNYQTFAEANAAAKRIKAQHGGTYRCHIKRCDPLPAPGTGVCHTTGEHVAPATNEFRQEENAA